MAVDEYVSRDTGVQKNKKIKNNIMMRQLDGLITDGLITDGLCTGAMICELMFKVNEGDMCLQRLLQFVPVIGNRELEGKASKGGVGFGGDQ